jgi:hypothetical protein
LFRAASTDPALRPYGIAKKQSIKKEFDTENPKRARAVSKPLTAMMSPIPNFFVSLSDKRLEIIVLPAIIMEIIPAYDKGTPI